MILKKNKKYIQNDELFTFKSTKHPSKMQAYQGLESFFYLIHWQTNSIIKA